MTEFEFQEVHEKHADPIFRYCFFRVSNREVAKDLTQDVFVRTWQVLEKGQKIEKVLKQ